MGMYTQIRGWLNVDSIGKDENIAIFENRLKEAQSTFLNDDTILDVNNEKLERKWVCNDTYIHSGGNGSSYIFFGTELKNYGCPAEIWIKYLLKHFSNAEGRIDFQYEGDDICGKCKFWNVYRGEITEGYCDVWCEGYGNMIKTN